MRRAVTGLVAGALLVLNLAACQSSTTQTVAQVEPEQTGSLCDRVQPALGGNWKTEQAEPWQQAPLSDICWLVDVAQPTHRIRVALSVLPVTTAEYMGFHEVEQRDLSGGAYAAKVIAGGVGAESWAVNPAAAAPWIVLRTNGRLVRLKEGTDGQGSLDELRTVASAITTLTGLPGAKPVIELPECARGTAAAEKALGSKAVVRRDSVVDGFAYCQWGSDKNVIYSRAGRVGSDPALDFVSMRDAGNAGWSDVHRVTVGTEGWQHSTGYVTYRLAQRTFVMVAAVRTSAPPAMILALAQAMAPTYRG